MGARLIRDPPIPQPLNPWRLVRHRRPTPPPAIVPSLSTLVLLVILALGAAGSWYLHDRAQRMVIVAARDLPAFHQIRASDLKKAELAAGGSNSGGRQRPSDMVGKYTLATVSKGKPLTAGSLGPR
jgi:Flp pilus assembly protein CpaB